MPTDPLNERLHRLFEHYEPGEWVRAIETIVYDGDEVAEGTIGRIQQTNVHGCMPLVTVAWEGRGGNGQPPHITLACSTESLEPVNRAPAQSPELE
jgi:hypothetical protein